MILPFQPRNASPNKEKVIIGIWMKDFGFELEIQKANIYFHPNMTHAQMVNWKREHLNGRVLVARPEPKEVA